MFRYQQQKLEKFNLYFICDDIKCLEQFFKVSEGVEIEYWKREWEKGGVVSQKGQTSIKVEREKLRFADSDRPSI